MNVKEEPHGRPVLTWVNKIKMNLREIKCASVEWIEQTKERV
jgi:hypothetical protein